MSKTTKKRLAHLEKYIDTKWNEYIAEGGRDLYNSKDMVMYGINDYPGQIWDLDLCLEAIKYNSEEETKNAYEKFKLEWYRKYMAVFKIQQYFNRMYDNPTYKFCIKHFNKKWNNN